MYRIFESFVRINLMIGIDVKHEWCPPCHDPWINLTSSLSTIVVATCSFGFG